MWTIVKRATTVTRTVKKKHFKTVQKAALVMMVAVATALEVAATIEQHALKI